MRTDILEHKVEIEQWILENKSKAYMARELKCNPKTINRVLAKLELNYDGNQSGKGYSKSSSKGKLNLVQYLETSKDIQTNKVRIKLLEEGYKEHKCENCGLTKWLDELIPLELHHKDGNRIIMY